MGIPTGGGGGRLSSQLLIHTLTSSRFWQRVSCFLRPARNDSKDSKARSRKHQDSLLHVHTQNTDTTPQSLPPRNVHITLQHSHRNCGLQSCFLHRHYTDLPRSSGQAETWASQVTHPHIGRQRLKTQGEEAPYRR